MQHLMYQENVSTSSEKHIGTHTMESIFKLVPDGCIALRILCRSSKRTGPAADVTSPAKSAVMLSTKFPALA